MQRIAIIPARSGSQRIARKNVKNFLGKPILAYPIEAALASKMFDTVMVSTDDTEIAELAIQLGASVPFMRSSKNADHFATTADVLLEVLINYHGRGEQYDYTCCLYPTAPFTSVQHLQNAFEHLQEGQYDCVFPVLEFDYPIQRALKMEEGKVSMFQPEHLNTRSQDLTPAFHDSGQFYWLNTSTFLHKKQIWTDHTGAIELSPMDAHDIDTEKDWQIAEFKYALNAQQKHPQRNIYSSNP
ncbi:MAG: pseudaminic acid cytidylyltransferase [Bacteroidota bacterium]